MRIAAVALVACAASCALAETKSILFVGNSFTYTRPPALQYNVDNVVDLTYPYYLATPADNDPALPQPYGGVAGLFEAMTTQAGLDYEVYHSLRGGATLRGHYLNTNPVGWDLRINMTKRAWDVMVIQGNSTEAVAKVGGDFPQFSAYVTKLERYVHFGAAESYRERDLYPGGNNTLRIIPANPNPNAAAEVYLYQTWARPDLTYLAGAPYAGQPLEAMTNDLRDAYASAAAANGRITGISKVGEAFMRAVQDGVATRNSYAPTPGTVDLWWHEDQFHPSKYGAYLSALVHFATITRLNPLMLGPAEHSASDLGIASDVAVGLQRVAQSVVEPDVTPPSSTATLSAAPNANGWFAAPVVVSFAASDNARGSGIQDIQYASTGGDTSAGATGASGNVTLAGEGTSTFAWHARDRAGNEEAAHSLVVRIDVTPPALALPANFAVDAAGPGGAAVTYVATATDNSGLAPTVACSPLSGSVLPIGADSVSCTATDLAGHSSTGSFIVTVRGGADQISGLIATITVLAGQINHGTLTSLTGHLTRALAAGAGPASCEFLANFEGQAAGLPAKVLSAAAAAELLAGVRRIRAVQGCAA